MPLFNIDLLLITYICLNASCRMCELYVDGKHIVWSLLDFHLVEVDELAVLLLSLYQHVEEFALAAVGDEATEEHVRDCHAKGNADDGERSFDHVVHTYGYLTHNTVHVDEGKERTVHQYSWYHRDDTRNGDALVRSVEPMACLDDDDADECRTCQRTDAQSHVETYVAIAWTEVDEVAEAYGDDATHCHNWEQATRYTEDGGESHCRYSGCYGKLPVFMVRSHGEVLHKVVDVAYLNGKCNTKRHRQYHQQGVEGSDHTHLYIAIEHITHKVDEWHSWHDEEGASHQWMPRGI